MLEFYADQTGTGELTILGGVLVRTSDLHAVTQDIMDFKVSHGLRANSPIKTAGWKKDDRLRDMQKLPSVPRFLTECCEFIAQDERLLLLACIVDKEEKGVTQEEADFFLVQNTAKRLQFEIQDMEAEYPDGPRERWSAAQPPRMKKGVEGRMVVDHPGTKQEAKWTANYSRIYKAFARPYTHLMHLSPALAFERGRESPLIQLADIIVGAVRLHLREESSTRFEMLLPRFRNKGGRIDGYGLVFDPKPGQVWEEFVDSYPHLASSVKKRSYP